MLQATTTTRLIKAAADNGFDLEMPAEGAWLGFASSHAPLRLWLTAIGDSLFLAAVSSRSVADALSEHGTAFSNPLPAGACAARGVETLPALNRLVLRAFQLSRALPDEPLNVFKARTESLPRSTEAERLVVQRVGQDVFRAGLLDYWEGRCAVTGLDVRELLRASHIKPWASCDSDAERLDVFNGLLLAPQLDAAFDAGFISFSDSGEVIVGESLTERQRSSLGLVGVGELSRLTDRHRHYLSWHRSQCFAKRNEGSRLHERPPTERGES